MSYNYYQEELNRLPANDLDGYGLSIQIRAGDGTHTKWLSLTDECKDALRKFITVEHPYNSDNPDPESMTDAQLADYWHEKWEKISRLEEDARKKLVGLLINKGFCQICPATWDMIISQVTDLLDSWRLLNGTES
jgi:hypothetical protein